MSTQDRNPNFQERQNIKNPDENDKNQDPTRRTEHHQEEE